MGFTYVGKKNGLSRFCVDYRKVNAVTQKDAYPLPRVDETLDTLSGSRWFMTLDLISGYWQVEVNPEDAEKTAFCTHEGLRVQGDALRALQCSCHLSTVNGCCTRWVTMEQLLSIPG